MNGEDYVRKAYERIFHHDFEGAIEAFEKAVTLEPMNASYHYKLSITYSRSGKLAKAREHAMKAIELDSQHDEYLLQIQLLQAKDNVHLAERLVQSETPDLAEAARLLKQAIKLDPLSVEAYVLLAEVKYAQHDVRSAIHYAKEALKTDPANELASALLLQYELWINVNHDSNHH
ncbi:hypothetical protein SY83_18445 [Paenibacillus swuensis]|uniref:Uncharacterized protein n=1 Tax=Paenibacillus swuensis TaxID=1178515 RepID=A0A172TLV6_9BACL|nr:tetratricopeptide repeat protein [Paenibacillus swuensis]ANE47946.1 hypothetical protein SY83_18445 [Paenibacillus swuensis]